MNTTTTKKRIQQQINVLKEILEQDDLINHHEVHQASLEVLGEALVAMGGRTKKIPVEKILELRAAGMAQEKIARELDISISSVRRELTANKNMR